MLELTPEARAEVRRNLSLVFGWTAAALLLFLLLLAAAINPPGGTSGYWVASLLLGALLLPVLAIGGACLTLAYPLGGWPGFMRSRTLAALYEIDAEGLSNQGMRRWMGCGAYWLAFGKGAAVALAFVGPWFLATWAMRSKGFPEGCLFPSLMTLIYLGGLAGKAWVVRLMVAERREGSPA